MSWPPQQGPPIIGTLGGVELGGVGYHIPFFRGIWVFLFGACLGLLVLGLVFGPSLELVIWGI